MYVCNCNGITERGVRMAVQSGAQHWRDVHAHHGCKPCCGRCHAEISDVIAEGTERREGHAGPMLGMPTLVAG